MDHPHPELPHAISLPSSFTYQLSFPQGMPYQGKMTTGYTYFLNLVNMAVKAAWLLGISKESLIHTLQTYQPEPTRTEIWKSPLGTTFVNDTYCSDPQSIDSSLHHFDYATSTSRKIFVFGGMRGQSLSPQADYRRIGNALVKAGVHDLLLIGQKPFQPLIEEVQSHLPETEILAFQEYQEAFSYLKSHLQPQDVVIFKGEYRLVLDLLMETFYGSLANNLCTINLAAIQMNLDLIQRRLPPQTRLMIIVKALAYGTGEVQMAKFLAAYGIDILGVSTIDEGIALKQAGVQQAIFVINAAPYEAGQAVKWELEVGVSNSLFSEELAKEANRQKKRIKVHLHIDTGMGRLGCRPEEALSLAHQICSLPSLELEGVMTHFACAENPQEDSFTWQQIACFDRILHELRSQGIDIKWTHAANSSGAIRFHLPQYNMVRLGLAPYGLYSSTAAHESLDLRLALSLTSRIVGINICKEGETVSYGRHYRVSRGTQKIAVLPIGYFDGVHRHYSGKGFVLIHGQKAPMVGTICMDYLMIDVTDIPEAAIGDKVLIFGEDEFGQYSSPEELANHGGSIVHELITCLGPRIQRIFVYEESKQIR